MKLSRHDIFCANILETSEPALRVIVSCSPFCKAKSGLVQVMLAQLEQVFIFVRFRLKALEKFFGNLLVENNSSATVPCTA
jgi:hypothetical protein